MGGAAQGDKLELQAGSLHGLRPQTVLAVYPPAGQKDADQVIGHVQVVQAGPLKSVVVPVAFGSLKAPSASSLPPGCRCKVVYVDFGDVRMKVALQSQAENSTAAAPAITTFARGKGPPELEAAMQALTGRTASLLERVDTPAKADWLVRLVDGQVCLVPADGWSAAYTRSAGAERGAAAPARFTLGSPQDAAELAGRLESALTAVARARRLIQLASARPDTSTNPAAAATSGSS